MLGSKQYCQSIHPIIPANILIFSAFALIFLHLNGPFIFLLGLYYSFYLPVCKQETLNKTWFSFRSKILSMSLVSKSFAVTHSVGDTNANNFKQRVGSTTCHFVSRLLVVSVLMYLEMKVFERQHILSFNLHSD